MHITFNLTGEKTVQVTGDFQNKDDDTCRALVGHLTTDFGLDNSNPQVAILYHSAPVDAGAGTYSGEADSQVIIGTDPDQVYVTTSAGSQTMTVAGDFSGTITFSNWQNSSGKFENGTVTWTCKP